MERKTLGVRDYERQLQYVAQKIYAAGTRRIHPNWPWVLIRVIPKSQQYGSLVLPDVAGSARQNKPLMEGVVLALWKPHWRKIGTKERWMESELKVGDRVLYHHYSGVPVNFLDENNYRLVQEWTSDTLGGIVGKLDYDGDKTMNDILALAFQKTESVTLSGS